MISLLITVALHVSSSRFLNPQTLQIHFVLIQSHTLNWEEAKFNSDEVILIKVKAPPSGGDVWGVLRKVRKSDFLGGPSKCPSAQGSKYYVFSFQCLWVRVRCGHESRRDSFQQTRDRLPLIAIAGCWAAKKMRQKMLFWPNIPKVFWEYIVGIRV